MGKNIELSPIFVYILSKKLDGIPGGGTTGTWSARVDKLYGICLSEFCPDPPLEHFNDEEYLDCSISIKAYTDAYTRRVQVLQRLYTLDECCCAINNLDGITISFDCFESILSAVSGDVPLPKVGEPQNGVHCVYAYGYNYLERYINFVNSWGEKWGNKGLGRLPMKYFEEELINEAWARGSDEPIRAERKFVFKNNKGERFIIKKNTYKALRKSTFSDFDVYDIYSSANIIIGFLNVSLFDENTLEIEDFFILPQYQKLGVGTALIKLTEREATKNNIKKIIGWVGAQDIIAEREVAIIGFFKKNNYSLEKDSSRYRDAYYKFSKDI